MKHFFTAVALALSVNAFAQLPTYVPTNGLVGYWPFSGNANDVSGNGNNGTVNGVTLTTDRFGNANYAYSFDGTSSYIQLPLLTALNNQSAASISFWENSNLQFTTANQPNGCVFSQWSSNAVSGSVGIVNVIGKNGYYLCSLENGVGSQSKDSIISANVWNHVVFVYDGTQSNDTQRVSVYVNDVFQGYFGNANIPATTGNQANETTIGVQVGNNPSLWNYFKGSLDDIGIWNRVLTPSEITALYNADLCYQTITVTDTLIINGAITGFNPITYANTIKVFPNPTADHITVDYGSNYSSLAGYTLKITNTLGQAVFATPVNGQTSYIDLSTWTGKGVYLVYLMNANSNVVDVREIVLQ